MFTLKCGDGNIGCGKTAKVKAIGDDADGFIYESFNGGYYICPNQCDDASVDVFDAKGKELTQDEPVKGGSWGLNQYTKKWKNGSWK